MRPQWKHIAIAGAIFPAAVLVFAWIGFFNIGASSGHWKITEWLLHTAMRTAVKTYAFVEVEPPPELPRRDIEAAAAHFARGCAGCHGAPGEAVPPPVHRMLPPPPDLAEKVAEWRDAELFWIVKNGVRFTGMPAWPTQRRDDEIWEMVAFLRALPAMDDKTYRRLSRGGHERLDMRPHTYDEALAECSRCHDRDGTKTAELLPIIAGQKDAYLRSSLEAYVAEERPSGIMLTAAGSVDRGLVEALTQHFAQQESVLSAIPPGRNDGSAAAEIIYKGRPDRAIPACIGCHGVRERDNEIYPKIAGQSELYLANQLRLFRQGARGGGSSAHLMHKAAEHLIDDEIDALALYLNGLGRADATADGNAR